MSNRGRPEKSTDDAREKLLEAARHCFTTRSYHEVTTRMLAEHAGVNAALIRYYFLNKEGLYKEMFISVTSEVMRGVDEAMKNPDNFDLEQMFRIFYRVMQKNPVFPLLMFKEIVLREGHCREFLKDVLMRRQPPFFVRVMEHLQREGRFRHDLDMRFVPINMMAMLVFPWYMREAITEELNMQFDEAMLDDLARHNAEVFKQGCFKEYGSDEN